MGRRMAGHLRHFYRLKSPGASFVKVLLTLPQLLAIALLSGCGNSRSLDNLIHVSIRASSLDTSTGVLQIQSNTDQPILLGMLFENLDNKQQRQYFVEIKPRQAVEVGILECGWGFVPNEQILIAKFIPGAEERELDKTVAPLRYKTYRADQGIIGIKPFRRW
jgi:hypothetical protein